MKFIIPFFLISTSIAWGQAKDCGEVKDLKSEVSQTKLVVRFVNQTSMPITAYWLDFGGEKQRYFEVNPGAAFNQATYLTHPWVLEDRAGNCVGVFEPKSADDTKFEIHS